MATVLNPVNIDNRFTITFNPGDGGDKTVIYDASPMQVMAASFFDTAEVQGHKGDESAPYIYAPCISSQMTFVFNISHILKEELEEKKLKYIPYYYDVYTDISRRWELLDI